MMIGYIRIKKYCDETGETQATVRNRIQRSQWVENIHYRRSKDGSIWINPELVRKLWIENEPLPTLA